MSGLLLAAGIAAGALAALLKLRVSARVLRLAIERRRPLNAALLHLCQQAFNAALLVPALLVRAPLFAGCAAGLILTPLCLALIRRRHFSA